MTDEIEYTIPEEFQIMAAHAGPIALRLSKRLHGKPDCYGFDECVATDLPRFINEKFDDMQEYLPELAFAINLLGESVSAYEIKESLRGVEQSCCRILDSMDDVKCAKFIDTEEAKPLLLAVMGRAVQDTALMFQTLQQAVMNPEHFVEGADGDVVVDLFIDFHVDEEMAALEAWVNRQSRDSGGGWGTLLAVFALGWWIGSD